MLESALSPSVSAFLREFIFSVEQLEILLLVSSKPETAWSSAAVYDVILSTPASVTGWLEFFNDHGFLTRHEDQSTYGYDPRTPELREMVSQTAQLYRTRPVRIIEAIYARDRAAHSFADSFRFKPK